ncbi:MAG: hypothetical protein EA425_05440 [Puniceicoccaceae bacterium]|nr:MAG: hypothetical protein EA425_05440 [Puniceicoccaceae bacterium]
MEHLDRSFQSALFFLNPAFDSHPNLLGKPVPQQFVQAPTILAHGTPDETEMDFVAPAESTEHKMNSHEKLTDDRQRLLLVPRQ